MNHLIIAALVNSFDLVFNFLTKSFLSESFSSLVTEVMFNSVTQLYVSFKNVEWDFELCY